MDPVTGYLIAFFCFWAGWLACALFAARKGSRREQARDDAEQIEYLATLAKRKVTA